MLFLLFVLFLLLFVIFSLPLKFPKKKINSSQLSIFYGAPGSGKTTVAAWYAKAYMNSGIKVYSNVPILGCYEVTKDDIGKYDISNGLLIWDEAGIDYNNRNFKDNFSGKSQNAALEWYKKHRHEHCEVMIFSQGFDDMDKKLRQLNTKMYIVRHSLIPGFIVTKRIQKRPDIDELTKQPIDAYSFIPLGKKWFFARSVWHLFDSFDSMGLPVKEFRKYEKHTLSSEESAA